jgi:hypothetical protein
MTPQELYDALSVPFPTQFIKWRVGSTNGNRGLPLCYVDARAVMDRLDSVCGMDGWQCNYTPAKEMLICNLGIRLPDNGEWIWKADGAGASDFEGEKGMASDALKRAAVRFGVARYLYDLKCDWVELDGKHLSRDAIKQLNEFHDEKIEEWGWDVGYRPGAYVFRILGKAIRSFVTDAASAQQFKTDNAGTIAQLPVRMRQRLNEELDQSGANATEAA